MTANTSIAFAPQHQTVHFTTYEIVNGNSLKQQYISSPNVPPRKYVLNIPVSAEIHTTLLCESRLNHYDKNGEVIRGKAGEWGIAQFTEETWKDFNILRKKQGLEELEDIKDPSNQIKMIIWAFNNGFAYRWTCYRNNY